jgi:high-affinity K+ transport system ATPase subunit B
MLVRSRRHQVLLLHKVEELAPVVLAVLVHTLAVQVVKVQVVPVIMEVIHHTFLAVAAVPAYMAVVAGKQFQTLVAVVVAVVPVTLAGLYQQQPVAPMEQVADSLHQTPVY